MPTSLKRISKFPTDIGLYCCCWNVKSWIFSSKNLIIYRMNIAFWKSLYFRICDNNLETISVYQLIFLICWRKILQRKVCEWYSLTFWIYHFQSTLTLFKNLMDFLCDTLTSLVKSSLNCIIEILINVKYQVKVIRISKMPQIMAKHFDFMIRLLNVLILCHR